MKTREQLFENQSESSYYLPTYEECVEMCELNPGIFYENKITLDGYDISMFNYMHAQFSDFTNPIPDKPHVNAYEMRGITFVFNKDGSLYKRYLLMNKFFNVNQVPDTMYSFVKDYKVKNIMNKEDGSLASFIQLPNGKVYGRSKMSFQSDQAIRINYLYNNVKALRNFIDKMMEMDIIPMFEYVASTNRIVLKYKNEDLILLRLRDNVTGKYHDFDEFKEELDGINVANFENEHTLEELMELKDVEVDKEGWVVALVDDKGNEKMLKIKTEWYFSRHSLFTSLLDRENDIIKLIIKDEVDDVISQLEEGDIDKKGIIHDITDIVNGYISKVVKHIDSAMDEWKNINDDLKGNSGAPDEDSEAFERMAKRNFAIKMKGDKYFPLYMSVIGGRDKYEVIESKILNDTKHLMQARKWLEKNK